MSGNLPPVRTCDRISEQIHLLADKELGPAETAVVEKHLNECPRCQVVAARLERMSSILKTWDAENNDHEAPALRLHNAVLARVAEQGAARRRENRLDQLVQFATAACVILALGAAVVIGLPASDGGARPEHVAADRGPTPLDTATVDLPDTVIAQEPFEDLVWAFNLEPAPGNRVKPLPEQQAELWQVQEIATEGSGESLAVVVERMRRVALLSEVLGTEAMACYMPSLNGQMPRTMPVRVYRYLYDRGLIRDWNQSVEQRGSRTVESGGSSTDDTPAERKTGKFARDLLAPMPGLPGTHLHELFDRPAIQIVHKRVGQKAGPVVLQARRIKAPKPALDALASTPLDPTYKQFLDPVAAQSSKLLKLANQGAGSVIALVEGTAMPIFIPAGQIITGGIADRVVAQPIWLPPAKTKTPYVIPCRVVENFPDGNADEEPMIQPWIAGPTIRALLAAGASQAEVKEAARIQVETYLGQKPGLLGTWSLKRLYTHKHAAGNMANLSRGFRIRDDDAGFVVTDEGGRLLGFEIVRLKGPAAAALMHRLWFSYSVESHLRPLGASTQAVAAPTDGVEEAMRRIATHDGSFRLPRGFTQVDRTRVSSVEIEAAGVHIHALETYGKPTVVSGLSSPTR